MNPVSLSESLRSSSSSGRSSSGASSAATFTGSLIRNGFAKTVTESSETASSTPLRSTIVPRRAGSAMSSICWLTARSDSEPGSHRAEPGGAQGRQPEQQQEEREQQADAALDEPHGRTPRTPLAAPGRRASLGSGHG